MSANSKFGSRRVRFLALTVLLAVLSGAFVASPRVRAEPAPNSAADAATTTVEVGDVDLRNSRVYIHVGKTGLGHEHAVEGRLKSGKLLLNGDASSSVLQFDMSTFVADGDAARKYIGLSGTTSPATQRAVTANMLGPDVLNARKHPTARLDQFKIVPLPDRSARGLPQYQVDCRLTLHGTSQMVRFIAEAASSDGWARIRGSVAIRQSSFGIKPYSTALGAVGVADALTVYGDLRIAERRFETEPVVP
jgi:polyisoprenoid-binding protein YceI